MRGKLGLELDGEWPGALGPCALVVASPGRAVHRGAINCANRALLRVWGNGVNGGLRVLMVAVVVEVA